MSSNNNELDGKSSASSSGIGRRPFIIGSLATLGAAAIGINYLVRQSGQSSDKEPTGKEVDLTTYEPKAFDQVEWSFLLAACDRLIPKDDEGPGALETNVPVFLDRQMLTPYGKGEDWYMDGPYDAHASRHFGYQMPFNLHTLYRKGIALTDQYVKKAFGKPFFELSAEQKDSVLHDLEKNKIDFTDLGEKDLDAAYFFARLLENTKEGYLADPQYGGNKSMGSWVMINFPGARASFPDWISKHNVIYPLKPVSLDGTQA